MNRLLHLFLLSCFFSSSALAQTTVELTVQHKFEKSNFVKGQAYMDENNTAILINRVQYYLSDIELIHDAGRQSFISTKHFLINGEQSSYDLGMVATTVDELEQLKFNLGVDDFSNGYEPMDFSMGHALAKTNMYSNDQKSYFFAVIEGMIDTDNDQIPDKEFVLRATNDQLLRHVEVKTSLSSDGNSLRINLVANIAAWLKNMDLETVEIQENAGLETELLCDNTVDQSVFSSVGTTDVTNLISPNNHIYIDSRLSYAPTIHYKFYTAEVVDMTITNTNGTYFIQRFDLAPDGDFYMSDDVASGVYIVIFTTPKGIRQSKRFVIRN